MTSLGVELWTPWRLQPLQSTRLHHGLQTPVQPWPCRKDAYHGMKRQRPGNLSQPYHLWVDQQVLTTRDDPHLKQMTQENMVVAGFPIT